MEKKHFHYWDKITDLAVDFGVPYPTAQSWVNRGSIPAKYDMARHRIIAEKWPDQAQGLEMQFEQWHAERSSTNNRKMAG